MLFIARLTLLTSLIFASHPAFAAAKDGGTNYICWNATSKIKISAVVSNRPNSGSNIASVTNDGEIKVYKELSGKKKGYVFLMGAIKNSTLQIKLDPKSPALVSLDTDPETSQSAVAHQGEGFIITIIHSTLTAPALDISAEPVTCYESKWTD